MALYSCLRRILAYTNPQCLRPGRATLRLQNLPIQATLP